MKRYAEYKDSGVKWLGKIPSHWEISRAKNMFRKERRAVRDEDEVVTCFRDGQVTLRKNRRTEGFTESLTEYGYQGVRKGDLVIHQMDAFAGSIGVSDSDGKGTSVYHCCTAKGDYNVYYYAYLLRRMAQSGFIQSLYRGIRERSSNFSFPVFGTQYLPIPPLKEQAQIANYLKVKTSKIDKYIKQREKEVKFLEELKQAEIANVVTKGLNPDVPMKDSGIPWLGMIPEHWEIMPFGQYFTFAKGLPITKADLQPNGIAVISYGQIHAKNNKCTSIPEELVRYVSEDFLKTHPQCLLRKNDFVFADTSEDIEGSGNFAFNDRDTHIFAGYHTLIARHKGLSCPKYYAMLFQSVKWKAQVQTLVNGVKVFSVGRQILKKSYLLFPPLEEQQAIVKYIDSRIEKIDRYIAGLTAEIEYLKEFKQRLISDAVTGQIKVTD